MGYVGHLIYSLLKFNGYIKSFSKKHKRKSINFHLKKEINLTINFKQKVLIFLSDKVNKRKKLRFKS